jgi:hypothetical protein
VKPFARSRAPSGPLIVAGSGLFFLLVGGAIATVFCWGLPTDIAISMRPLAITGDVVRAELEPGIRINRRMATRITYRYVVAGRSYVDDILTVDADLVRAASAQGARVALEVDRESPKRSRVAGDTRSLFGWFGAFTLVVPLVGVVQLAVAAVLALRARGRRRR